MMVSPRQPPQDLPAAPIHCEAQPCLQPDANSTDPHFNAPLSIVREHTHRPRLLFIHVGRCAGAAIHAATQAQFGSSIHLFRYHSFEANHLIEQLLRSELGRLPHRQRPVLLISTRDPVSRWFSAFNWDLHDLYLRHQRPLPESYRRFGRATALAAAIALADPEALAFANSHPMGMGLSWYLPLRLLPLLEGWRVFRIRQERLDEDFQHFVADYRRQLGLRLGGMGTLRALLQPQRARPLTCSKHPYREAYPPHTFATPTDCDAEALAALRRFLRSDGEVATALHRWASRP